METPPHSSRTSSSDETALDAPLPSATTAPKHHTPLFSEPGSIPLADAGFRELGVVWEGLTVHGVGKAGSTKTVEGLEVSLLKMWDFPGFVKRLFNITYGSSTRPLISDFSGVVPAGETLLVLGRPGSGCSTFLRALANTVDSFAKVDGDISYGSIGAKEASKRYGGDIVFNSEEDIHIPLLAVGQTLGQALAVRQPADEGRKKSEFVEDHTNRLLNAFGMPHTRKTVVGSDVVRGVSGGERKRVSLAEVLATNAAVAAWDNCVRGLDSAVALHFLKVLKELSRSTGMTNLVTIYQASQEMYDTCFDRVVVLYEGMEVFSGRASEAEAYFIEMGWEKGGRQTTPDFLTACTSPTERRVRKGHAGVVPQTAAEFAAYFKSSRYYAQQQGEIQAYKAEHAAKDNAERFRLSVKKSKSVLAGRNNPFKRSFYSQVAVLIKTKAQVEITSPADFVTRITSNCLQATLVGAIFYKPADNAAGAFAVAGALYFAILYYTIFAFGEVPTVVNSRPLYIKHRQLGFYHPAAVTIAQMALDVPLYTIQTLIFSSILYFIVGLTASASQFFTFWFVVFSSYVSVSAMYRAIASWSPNLSVAVRYGGFALCLTLTVAGFPLPVPQQLGWSSWMRRISVPTWALESLMANEFRTRDLRCVGADLVPNGPSYDSLAYQGCTIEGGVPGSAVVDGATFISDKYGFKVGHIWRNVGVIWAFTVIYTILIIVGSNLLIRDSAGGAAGGKIYKRGAKITPVQVKPASTSDHEKPSEETKDLTDAPGAFTFKNVTYSVQFDGTEKQLLNHVTGFVKPGRMCALMGASGAGKTTLLDTIAGRKTTGKVGGEMLIDGAPLPSDFSRRTGFCQQGDVHEPFSTVREALQFSALLRQTGYTREERLAYAEEVIELLELGPIADALVGNADVGGLGIEERKRLTLGVELAARPDGLLFLDEPTSGLDSQAAYEIVRFLKKVTSTGIAILCTIHQPSGDLFELFDDVVLLAPGGNTVYAGPNGHHASTITSYFGARGAHCPPTANPAEHILSTVAPVGVKADQDWPALWKESEEAKAIEREIQRISMRTNGQELVKSDQAPASAYAASYTEQVKELAQWRDGPYWTSKLVGCIFFGMFIGFYMYQLNPTMGSIPGFSVGILILTASSPPLALDVGIRYQSTMVLYTARERSGIYRWQSLVTAMLITETPIFMLSYTLLFFCSFWTMGFHGAEAGAITWLSYVLLGAFTASFGLLLGTVSPTPTAVPFILSILWNLFNCLSWCLVTWDNMPSPFKWFFSWLSPLRWLYGAIMTADLSHIAITCSEEELTRFNIPAGETCASYAADFLSTAAGYLANPDATSNCGYCAMKTGEVYISQLGYAWEHIWRDWGIFLLFCFTNIATLFGLTYLCIIRPLHKN
ncbi:hypothetical protein JCM11251_005643 [Rhodosporidiobolus azoricus]